MSPDPLLTTDHIPDATAAAPAGLPIIPGYQVRREIARGGMRRVLAAYDTVLERDVALKILLPGAKADRFLRESRITARLPHPGIPPVHALGAVLDTLLAGVPPFAGRTTNVGADLTKNIDQKVVARVPIGPPRTAPSTTVSGTTAPSATTSGTWIGGVLAEIDSIYNAVPILLLPVS